MPSSIQQNETLPEGLVTTETIQQKTPLIEPVVNPKEETQASAAVVIEEATKSEETDMSLFETKIHVITCSLEKLSKCSIDVNIIKDKEVALAQQKCFILTVHDLGFDNSQFDDFINCQFMQGLRNRSIWLNCTLPGQEIEASDLSISKYPTLEELADELVTVLDHFKLQQVVLLGEGVGATICTHFAIRHPNRCYGLICVEPIVSSATYLESWKYKLQNFKFNKQKSAEDKKEKKAEAEPLPDATNENESFHLHPVDKTTDEKYKNRNLKNMSLFAEAFLNRTNLISSVSKLKVDTLIASNKNSTSYTESNKLWRSMQECNKKNLKSLMNSPFIEIENINESERIFVTASDQFATSLQFFLQGIGLLSAMPMKKCLSRLNSVSTQGRAMSVDESAVNFEITPTEIAPAAAAVVE